MKVAHICISAPYIDGWGYQENLLPHYMAAAGAGCTVIAPADNFPSYLSKEVREGIASKGIRYRVGDVDVVRVGTLRLSTSLLFPRGMTAELERLQPDAIFHHNVNCSSLVAAARYARKHGIPLIVDNHADEINMSSNRAWVFLYYKVLLRLTCRLVGPDLFKAYGVTWSRCSFLKKYYGVDDDKISFLPIGCDSELSARVSPKEVLRQKYGFDKDDEIVVCGGKLGIGKGTVELIEALRLVRTRRPGAKLLLFGRVDDGFDIPDEPWIKTFGWCDRITTLELLKLSDVACWPVHHTTLIEDAVSVRLPLVLRKTETTRHLVSGNGLWLDDISCDDIAAKLIDVLERKNSGSLLAACVRKFDELDYKNICVTVLNDINGYKQ